MFRNSFFQQLLRGDKMKKQKFVVSATLNTGTCFEDHNHHIMFECYIEAESEEEAKKIIAKDLHIEVYPKAKNHKLMKAEYWAKAVWGFAHELFE